MGSFCKSIALLLMCGVFGAVTDEKSVSVNEGESVTLQTHVTTELQDNDKIRWRFGEEGSVTLIAEMSGGSITYEDLVDGRFRDRLQILDLHTGDLVIKNIKHKHSGRYKVGFESNAGTTYKIFRVNVNDTPTEFKSDTCDVKSVSVTEEGSVTLHTDVQTQRDALIVWRFGDGGVLLAKDDQEDNKSSIYDDDGMFRDRLKLDDHTGSLIITNTKTTDTGLYKLQISSNRDTKYKTFSVSVSEPGLSAGRVTGIIFGVLMVIAVVVIVYRRIKYEQQKQKVKEKKVLEGDSVTLESDVTKLQSDDVIQWIFTDEVIAAFNKNNKISSVDERFTDRLKVDNQTGSLIIRDIRTEDAGLYKVKMSSSRVKSFLQFITGGGPSYSQLSVIVKERIKSVKSEGSVTLKTGVTGIQTDDEIQWRFGDEETPIAQMTVGAKPSYDSTDERFTDRMKMNPWTGDLIITHITAELSGVYRAQIIISSRGTEYRRYRVAISVFTYRGESVTLNTESEIQRDSEIKWTSEDKTILVTGKNGDVTETKCTDDERFRGRLKMNHQTGDLTITKIRQTDAELYTLQINSDGKISNRIFSVCVRERIRSVKSEGSVTLKTDVTEIQTDDEIQWRFGDEETLIAEMTVGTEPSYDSTDERFTDRLKMNPQTGHLTITHITAELSGVYRAQISSRSRGTEYRRYRVDICDKRPLNQIKLNSDSAYGTELNKQRSERKESVLLGGSVTLYTDVTEIQTDDVIQWRFGDEETLIAEMTVGTEPSYDSTDERFTDRLKMNPKTGHLIITDITAELSGVYRAQISSSRGTEYRTYRVDICDKRPLNQIKLNSDTADGTELNKQRSDSTGTKGNESTTVDMMPLLNEAEDRCLIS